MEMRLVTMVLVSIHAMYFTSIGAVDSDDLDRSTGEALVGRDFMDSSVMQICFAYQYTWFSAHTSKVEWLLAGPLRGVYLRLL